MKLLKKIDVHAHVIRRPGPARSNGTNMVQPETLCELYDRLNVEKGILLPLLSPESAFYTLSSSEDVHEIASRYPNRFAWFCNIDPRIHPNSSETDFDYLVQYYKALGAKGLGEITANLPFDDPRVYALFRACEKQDMPVTFHIGHTNGEYGLIDELGLPKLEKALQDFPNLRFLAHSQRFWSHISADVTEETRHGWPKGKVIPGGKVTELMGKYPNLLGDLSAGSGYCAITRDPEFGYAFLEEFQDKLHFGMDICCPENINSQFVKLGSFLDNAVLEGKISYNAYRKISRENTLQLLD